MASCRLLGLVAETLFCRVWLQVGGVGCHPLDVVFFWLVVLICRTLEMNNKERLKK